ncbi:MAG: type IV pilus modification PilV family protein [Thermoanaerobaculia bacterium]
MTTRRRERGLTLVEMLLALALLGFILLGIVPLFLGSVKLNYSANEYTSIHNLSRDRLEQLMNLPFNDAQLSAGVHPNDLPPVMPDPATGVPPATGGVVNPFTLSYQVMQYQAPNACDPDNPPPGIPCPVGFGVKAGEAFTPTRITGAGQTYNYKRVDVTVRSRTGPLGIGARVARLSGIIVNPSPATNLSAADAGP